MLHLLKYSSVSRSTTSSLVSSPPALMAATTSEYSIPSTGTPFTWRKHTQRQALFHCSVSGVFTGDKIVEWWWIQEDKARRILVGELSELEIPVMDLSGLPHWPWTLDRWYRKLKSALYSKHFDFHDVLFATSDCTGRYDKYSCRRMKSRNTYWMNSQFAHWQVQKFSTWSLNARI